MLIAFYLAAAVAILATTIAITRNNAVHALLYLIVSLLAVAVIFYVIGAPFLAALELIIYAGAIMVLFLFVVMMLNVGELHATEVETEWLKPGLWAWPSALATLLIAELAYVSFHAARPYGTHACGDAKRNWHLLVWALRDRRGTRVPALNVRVGGRLSLGKTFLQRGGAIRCRYRWKTCCIWQ